MVDIVIESITIITIIDNDIDIDIDNDIDICNENESVRVVSMFVLCVGGGEC